MEGHPFQYKLEATNNKSDYPLPHDIREITNRHGKGAKTEMLLVARKLPDRSAMVSFVLSSSKDYLDNALRIRLFLAGSR